MSAFRSINGVGAGNSNSIFSLVTQINGLAEQMEQTPQSAATPVQQRTGQAFARGMEERKDNAPQTPERAARAQVAPNAPLRQQNHQRAVGMGHLQPARLVFGSQGAPSSMAAMEVEPDSPVVPEVRRLAGHGQTLFL